MIDIVTVTHNRKNSHQALALRTALSRFEDPDDYTFHIHRNARNNVGFAKGCNLGAFREGAEAPIIGFINPDAIVGGPFIRQVMTVFDAEPNTVITGNRFNKPARELKVWGVKNWVCGATFFVRRDWFTEVGGFDERYVWSWEETDLIRTAESQGRHVHSREYPIKHDSPTPNEEDGLDTEYKRLNFKYSQQAFQRKWGRR